MRILAALLRKELKLMRRNPLVIRVIIAMPLMVMLVMPLIATLDVKNVGIAVVDNDHSLLSRRIIQDLNAAESLHVNSVCSTHSEAMTEVERGNSDVILTIPQDFEQNPEEIDVEANGVNATKGMLGAQYVVNSVALTLRQWLADHGAEPNISQLSIINRYNPTLEYRNYMIPAFMVVLIIIICGFLPALNLVSEKETGTIDAMNVSPVGRLTFVLSKLIIFWIVGLLVVAIGMTIGYLVYDLAPQGSVIGIFVATILFSLVMSGIGVTIANKSATMMQSIFVMFAFIMIFQLMSGLFTPISSMPRWAQCVTLFIPPRYFVEIMRSIYLKATPLTDLWPQYAALAALALATCSLAAITYKKTT
ncbi:MAG: ABC transporter permease [Muribaculaceae bacterium]|nr:ABC transporter permease [Muribaculaceae bacterium]